MYQMMTWSIGKYVQSDTIWTITNFRQQFKVRDEFDYPEIPETCNCHSIG